MIQISIRKLYNWFRTWHWELWALPFAVGLFLAAGKVIRWIDPMAGVYDSGVLQGMFISALRTICGTTTAWILIRVYFRAVWDNSDHFRTQFNSMSDTWKVVTTIGLFLGLLLAFSISSSGSPTQPNCVIEIAKSQIGVHELTNNNDGVDVEKYLSHVHLKKGNPWCAAFVSWVLDECGVRNPQSGYCPDWFRSSVIYMRGGSHSVNNIVAGDVFGIYFIEKNRIAHVGLIEWVRKGIVLTIEGNTNEAGSREGDGVYRKRRLLRQIYAVRSIV